MERDFKGVWIPKEIWLNQELGWTEKLLFIEIDSLAKMGECFASNDHFAVFLSVTTRQIQKILASLQNKGFIKIQLFYKGNTRIVCKRIIVPIHKFTGEQKFAHMDEEKFAHMDEQKFAHTDEEKFVDNNTLIKNTNTNTINNKKINKKSAEIEFEELWKSYPRKQGNKNKAKEYYIKAIKKGETTYEIVKTGIEMYKKYIEYQNVPEEYIKHGSTWFNGHCWDNDYTCRPKLVQGKSHGFLGLLTNEMDYQHANVIDYEGEIINEQGRSYNAFRHVPS